MAEVILENICKEYANGHSAVANLDLKVDDGEFLVLVGPSGCGKSTALRMIGGLESITKGTLMIGDRVVNDVQTKDRDIAMVFQNYALYPHMTVEDNMGFALKVAKQSKSQIKSRVAEAAAILDLTEYLHRKPGQLSGGQRQRVAMGRAIVRQPQVFLMDEPLSNLDAKLRVQMRAEISSLQKKLGVTTIYVTHDQVEAMTMGDRVAVLKKGVLQQVGSPQHLYDSPDNVFVAAFIGSPSMNLFKTVLRNTDGQMVIAVGDDGLVLDPSLVAKRPGLGLYRDREIIVGIRPEDIEDASLVRETGPSRQLKAEVQLVESLGAEIVVHLSLPVSQYKDKVDGVEAEDDSVDSLGSLGEDRYQGRFSPRSTVRRNESLVIDVDTARLHFFDPDTGEAV